MSSTDSPLSTDLYELTMAAGYFENHFNPLATFELFVRSYPENRNYLVFAGLEQALDYVRNLTFTNDDIEYLKGLPEFKNISGEFWKYLRKFKFSGEIWSVNEGDIVFPMEPLIRVTAPIIEAQILETFLLTTVNFQTTIASKASRVYHAANIDRHKRVLMEFGSRRAHGPQAGVLAARASYIAGFDGTSNVLSGKQFNIPVYGTAAHSWMMAFQNESKAFEAYHKIFPDSTVLLVDTFNTNVGIENAIKIGKMIRGIRIDSGDLLKECISARRKLDQNGLSNVKIILSGDLNEIKIEELIKNHAPVDSFGVGTQLTVSADAPYLGGIYKLVQTEEDGEINYTAKLSTEKQTFPGKKQIIRQKNPDGYYSNDIITLEDEEIPGDRLLNLVYKNGTQLINKSTREIQQYHLNQIKKFPSQMYELSKKYSYDVKNSDSLMELFITVTAGS